MNIAVLASHEGTTLQAIIDACASGTLPARIVLVISNNREAGALRRARAAGLPALHLSRSTHPEAAALDAAMLQALREAGADLVFLAGYMRPLGRAVLDAYAGRILNTHPALLPRHGGRGLYGLHVHAAVLAAGDRETGVSIHHVTQEYDTGPLIAQARVPVLPGDTAEQLAARVQQRERAFIVEVLREIATGQRVLPGSG